jgi:hypothetical protein
MNRKGKHLVNEAKHTSLVLRARHAQHVQHAEHAQEAHNTQQLRPGGSARQMKAAHE